MEQIKTTHAAFVASRAIVRLLPSFTLWGSLTKCKQPGLNSAIASIALEQQRLITSVVSA